MDHLKKIGVCLKDEAGDKEALAFTALLARMLHPEVIHCMHVRGIEWATDTPAPEPEALHGQLCASLPKELAEAIEIHISRGAGLGELLRTARGSDLDLMVVGRRLPSDQFGLGAPFYRLARKTPCDVLVVPEHARAHLSRLLVLLDGSEHSRMALETAIRLARASGERAQVLGQSVYCVPYGHGYAGMSREEASRRLEALQRKKIEEYLENVDTSGVDFEVVYTCSHDSAAAAHDLASAMNMDAIVIGSRGATLPAIALLGGTTERVLLNASVPVLVVKRKGETFQFLDAVLAEFRESE